MPVSYYFHLIRFVRGALTSLAAVALAFGVTTRTDWVEKQNSAAAAEWVNWYPSGWSGGKEVEDLARQITASCGEEEVTTAVYDWICENISYDEDALNAGIYSTLSAEEVLRERRGVCEGVANLAQSLYLDIGVPCIKVWGVAIQEGDTWEDTSLDLTRVNHTWNEIWINGNWHPIDCTMDMGGVYSDGVFLPGESGRDYYLPDMTFFSRTHLILRRSLDFAENIPSVWAVNEVTCAVEADMIPLDGLQDYRRAVSEEEFFRLFGIAGEGTDSPVRRIDAAMALYSGINAAPRQLAAFPDMQGYPETEQEAAAVLYEQGIMVGDGSFFMPEKQLTREEAYALLSRVKDREE